MKREVSSALALIVALAGCRGGSRASSLGASSTAQPGASAPVAGRDAPTPNPRPKRAPMTPFDVPGLDGLAEKPLIALWERDPWLAVIGSDVPTVVVYESGLVIKQSVQGKTLSRVQGRLTRAAALALAARVDEGLAKSPASTTVTGVTDQRRVELLVRGTDGWREASCYGLSRTGKASHGEQLQLEPPPPGFVAGYLELLELEPPGASPWIPQELEIMLWGFEHARGAKPWPSGVPTPASTLRPPKSGVVKHVVSGKYLPALDAYLAGHVQEAVELNGHKWSMRYRVRVPAVDFLARATRCAVNRQMAVAQSKPPPRCD
ncbi:MAG: hypothetical protein OZ921_11665 [Sorangiineae bacterium]|nr:hypothetical protein [Polyangiaceae bacterium]MEB2323164.1 hypothetical protein [Sorangiineae bacterium]